MRLRLRLLALLMSSNSRSRSLSSQITTGTEMNSIVVQSRYHHDQSVRREKWYLRRCRGELGYSLPDLLATCFHLMSTHNSLTVTGNVFSVCHYPVNRRIKFGVYLLFFSFSSSYTTDRESELAMSDFPDTPWGARYVPFDGHASHVAETDHVHYVQY